MGIGAPVMASPRYFETSTPSTRTYRDGDKLTNKAVAATTVTSKTIEGKPNANFVQTLQGQVPGVYINTGSEQYGANSTVVLRGYGSVNGTIEPLYVIDGVPLSAENFKSIDPKDIESVSVLKDAGATSIYGNRGANGVVIVKTKNALTEKEKRKLERLNKKLEKQKKEHPETIMFMETTKRALIEVDHEEYESFEENQFENPVTTPLSTFSIDVDNASYTNIRRFLNNGQTVPKDAVRVEEMINFFKYQYPQPINNEPFSINTEYSDAPWNPQHKLLRIGLQGKIIPDDNLPASNFVFLIDVSGSMGNQNKLPLLKQSMKLLVEQMRKKDKIAIVVYAGAAGLVLPSTDGNEKEKIYAALDNLNAGGSTAGGEGIELAYKTAQENFVKNGNNRVILATDGDFNVGASSDSDMQTLIEEKRKSGVFLTCLGYGMGNYKDSKMEILADKGNGNYAYIDNMQEADRYLNKEFKGSMYAIAKDVKIQIEFNPKHVQSYRLIGYENRKLRDEDFANDAIDAGELGSGHTVTALYEIIPTGIKSEYFNAAPELKYSQPTGSTNQYNDELATIKFRSKKPNEDKSTEIVKIIPNNPIPMQNTSGDFKFSAAVAWFGLKLRDSKLVSNKKTDDIKALAKQGLQNDPDGYRAEFVRLVDMVK
ncbi:vWA domain-containing protein [Flavobacterium hauense]